HIERGLVAHGEPVGLTELEQRDALRIVGLEGAEAGGGALDERRVLAWLDQVIRGRDLRFGLDGERERVDATRRLGDAGQFQLHVDVDLTCHCHSPFTGLEISFSRAAPRAWALRPAGSSGFSTPGRRANLPPTSRARDGPRAAGTATRRHRRRAWSGRTGTAAAQPFRSSYFRSLDNPLGPGPPLDQAH